MEEKMLRWGAQWPARRREASNVIVGRHWLRGGGPIRRRRRDVVGSRDDGGHVEDSEATRRKALSI